jgi:chaperonin cofactor prefoldin
MTTITEVDAKINAHIDICEVRYRGIEREMQGVNARLKRLEQILISGAGAIVILLITLLMKG